MTIHTLHVDNYFDILDSDRLRYQYAATTTKLTPKSPLQHIYYNNNKRGAEAPLPFIIFFAINRDDFVCFLINILMVRYYHLEHRYHQ